jgi:hypothetical protein
LNAKFVILGSFMFQPLTLLSGFVKHLLIALWTGTLTENYPLSRWIIVAQMIK